MHTHHPHHSALARLMSGFVVPLVLIQALPDIGWAEDLKVRSGKVFTNVITVTDAGDKIKITHSAGIAAVPKKDVPPDFLTRHEIPLDATPPAPAASAPGVAGPAPSGDRSFLVKDAAPPPAVAGRSPQDKEDTALTALSIIGLSAVPVELLISNYESNTFVGEATFIEMKSRQETVKVGTNGLQRRDITATKTVGVPVPWHLIKPMRVHGLPKTLALGPKLWKGYLWIGWERDGEREAFTTKESAVKYMVENGVGKKPKRTWDEPEFHEQEPEYLRSRGLWTGQDAPLPAPRF